ncbi:Nucleosome assembly protein (NAP) family protein [Cryptosporidium meleagridis]|uniref:Nucleosome assembly protein (NAP) family protein n=1 Tax=Cryptosporidium meleagridis TaxID=93969 RepID=A0A2P4Z3W4_9CRYT|nr:Nucleosome assembly protein (NAP) family protein [Cryptosporidium meleagridis]
MKKQKLDLETAKTSNMGGQTNSDEKQELLSKLEEVDTRLMELDSECAKEQMNIQRQFDEKKKPIFDERRAIIEKIPKFWADTISRHPVFQDNMHPEDFDILEYLKDIELEDNLDNEGSYKIKLIFDEAVSEFMEPNILVKHIIFKDNQEIVNEVTKINWKKESPRSIIEKKFIDTEENKEEYKNSVLSFFDFFSENISDDNIDIGEVIRRDIYHAPLLYYREDDSTTDE